MAVTLDMLKLSGDSRAADELELSFYNAALGAQHPSGRWCTYSTPMDGTRESSAHSIVFQARAGTPELNCCSVNGPRGLGLLSEWAVMAAEDALAINYYGPGMFQGKLADNTPVAIDWITQYPLSEKVTLRIEPLAPRRFRLLLRIPSWSQDTVVDLNGKALPKPVPGSYLELNRRWEPGDRIGLQFDFQPRAVPGDREALGKISVYRGPILLAYDQALNDFDQKDLPPIDLPRLVEATVLSPAARSPLAPWLMLDLPATEERHVRVCDFASAGVKGTHYRSWLPTRQPPPPPVVTRQPKDGAALGWGNVLFRWTGPKRASTEVSEYRLTISPHGDLSAPVVRRLGLQSNELLLTEAELRALAPNQPHWWHVVAVNANGSTESLPPPARFTVDPQLPPVSGSSSRVPDENALLISASLAGQSEPEVGELRSALNVHAVPDQPNAPGAALETDGAQGRLVFGIEEFPDEDYSVSVWVSIKQLPEGRLGQVCSAWTAPMDDPLRICIENGKVFARIEAGQSYGTPGTPIEVNHWYYVAAVKAGTGLTLYLDGEPRAHATVPLFVSSRSHEIALGANPRYAGNEFLAARFAGFSLYGRALTVAEIKAADKRGKQKK
jgi:hypothetical protein